jgi:hypothetical protein
MMMDMGELEIIDNVDYNAHMSTAKQSTLI